jgi:hypothetical protein
MKEWEKEKAGRRKFRGGETTKINDRRHGNKERNKRNNENEKETRNKQRKERKNGKAKEESKKERLRGN